MQYRRTLPHWIPDGASIFLTWRLAGSLPAHHAASVIKYDEQLDNDHSGPRWLSDHRIAGMVASAIRYGEAAHRYTLHAWAVMPNHVHLVLTPQESLADVLRWLKGRTGRIANQILGRTGLPFWQAESYDHWIRSREELNSAVRYVERNPVKAGLVNAVEDWPWSSARAGQTTKTDRLPHRERNSQEIR